MAAHDDRSGIRPPPPAAADLAAAVSYALLLPLLLLSLLPPPKTRKLTGPRRRKPIGAYAFGTSRRASPRAWVGSLMVVFRSKFYFAWDGRTDHQELGANHSASISTISILERWNPNSARDSETHHCGASVPDISVKVWAWL